MPMLTTLRIALAGVPGPLAASGRGRRTSAIRSSTACTSGTTSSPSTTIDRVARRAQRDVQHGAVLGDVDLLAAEHRVDALAQARLARPAATQQPQRLVGDAVLRVVEVEAGGLERSAAPARSGSSANRSRRWALPRSPAWCASSAAQAARCRQRRGHVVSLRVGGDLGRRASVSAASSYREPWRPALSVAEDRTTLDELCVNTIRTLSMDAVQKANSGHPGHADGARAARLRALHAGHAATRPSDPDWPDRDRFVLSLRARVDAPVLDAVPDRLRRSRSTTSSTSASSARRPPGTPSTATRRASRPPPARSARASRPPSAWRCRAHARRALQPRRPRDRRPLHVRDRLRRRPAGGRRLRGLPRSPATSASAS